MYVTVSQLPTRPFLFPSYLFALRPAQDIGAVTGAAGAVTLELEEAIRDSPYYVPAWGEPGAVQSFDKWMVEGNPFKRGCVGVHANLSGEEGVGAAQAHDGCL